MLRNLILFLGFLTIVAACEFKPGLIPDSQLEKPSETPPGIRISLTPETDTLFIPEFADIMYAIDAAPKEVYHVDFYIGNQYIGQRDYQPGQMVTFRLDMRTYLPGNYEFKMNIFTSTNSGSIADKIGAEGYLYSLTWPLVIDRTPSRPLHITSVDPVPEGGVMVNWEKFTAGSFQHYLVYKQNMYSFETDYVSTITNRFNSKYYDSDYLEGEVVYYRIVLNEYPGPGFRYSEKPAPPVVTNVRGFDVEVSWSPSRNPSRLDFYRLFLNDMISPRSEVHIKGSEGINQHIFSGVRFGADLTLTLQFVPKTTQTNTSFMSLENSSIEISIGDSIPVSDAIRKLNGTGSSLLSQGNRLLLFNHQQRKVLSEIDFSPDRLRAFRVTHDGKYVYTLVDNTIRIYEPLGFNLVASENLADIDPALSTIYEMYPSDNMRLMFVTGGFRVLVYDFTDRKVILKSHENTGLAIFSPSGDKVLAYGSQEGPMKYYRIKENQLELIGEIPGSNAVSRGFAAYSPVVHNHVVLFGENTVEIRNADNFNLVKRHEVRYGGVVSWDQENYRFIAAKENNWLGDMSNIIQLPEWEVVSPDLYLAGNVVLNSEYLVARNGRQLKLNELAP